MAVVLVARGPPVSLTASIRRVIATVPAAAVIKDDILDSSDAED
jgi:hypothetical protein